MAAASRHAARRLRVVTALRAAARRRRVAATLRPAALQLGMSLFPRCSAFPATQARSLDGPRSVVPRPVAGNRGSPTGGCWCLGFGFPDLALAARARLYMRLDMYPVAGRP